MPDPPDPHTLTSKRRRIGRPHSSSDAHHPSSFTSPFDDARRVLHDQANTDHTTSAKSLQQTEKLDPLASGKYHHEKVAVKHGSLKECMDSIMAELREARENLLEWMRREIQAISTTTEANSMPHAQIKRTEGDANDESQDGLSHSESQNLACSKADITAQPPHDLTGGTFDGQHMGSLPQHIEPQDQTAPEVSHDPNGSGISSPRRRVMNGLLDVKNRTSEVTAADDSIETEKDDLNDMNKGGNQQTRKEDKNDYPVLVKGSGENDLSNSKAVAPSNAVQQNESSRENLDEDKDGNGTYGPPEGFTFKINRDIEKRFDERPGVNFVIGSQDRESNGDTDEGLGCSLSSTSSGKENLGLSKAFNVGSYGSFSSTYATVYEEQIKAEPGLGSRFVTPDIDVFNSKMNNEFPNVLTIVSKEAKNSRFGNATGVKLDEEGKINDSINGMSDVSYRHNAVQNKSLVGGHMLVQSGQLGDPRFPIQTENIQHHLGTNSIFGCGVKRSHETAMSLNGFELEKEHGMTKGNEKLFSTNSFSTKSKPNAMKRTENVGLHPSSDKANFRFWNENNIAASTSLSGIPLSRNAINRISHGTQMNQSYHNKIADVASTGRTANFTGFDSHFSFPSQVQTVHGVLDVYQSRPNSIPVCFPNSEFLHLNGPTQFPPVSVHNSPVSSSSAMLIGMTGVTPVNQDPSNAHTFLGLGMNAQPVAMNQTQELSGLYTRDNVYHNHALKQAALSSSLAVSNQKDSGQARNSLELKF